MTTRTHLSIGEVLSLLTDDFPDLTITKIRFLESQGLIDPERTASGYRKFYDFDIERLRWILRQQRENFLPLKVIKDRLDRSDGRLPEADTPGPAQPELDLARDPGSADPPPVWMADHAKGPRDRAAGHRDPDDGKSDDGNSDGGEGDERAGATPPSPAEPAADAEPRTSAPEPAPRGRDHSGTGKRSRSAAAPAKKATTPPPPAKTKTEPKAGSAPAGAATATRSEPARGHAAGTPAKVPANRSETTMATPTAPGSGSEAEDLTDVSLNRAELLGASGLDDRQLTQLESFGIVVPVDGHDDALYGAEALVCARQAAVFLELGMEPRHLRAFKVAADREAGLYEQLVLPLLRQRNPAARAEATRTVGRLAAAGAAIHAALLQQSLRTQLRPRR